MLRNLCVLLLIVLLLFSVAQALAESDSNLKAYKNLALGIQFRYPKSFEIGSFRIQSEAESDGFKDNIVVVESSQRGTHSLSEIPIGEIPSISIKVVKGSRATFLRGIGARERIETKKLGEHELQILPGYPGPYGDQAFYYLVPWGNDKVIEFTGHRYYFRGPENKSDGSFAGTKYNEVIESIIESMKLKAD